jgi:hypothetical protein
MKKLIGKGTARLVASLTIWLVFMIFLMTAVTQQSVSARIDKSALGLGYSATLASVKEVKLRQKDLPDQRRAQAELLKQLTGSEQREEAAQGKYSDGWDAAVPILRRLAREPECEIAFDAAQPVPYGARAALWGLAKVCVEERAKELPATVVASFNSSHFPQLRREALSASAATAKLKKQVTDGAASIAKTENPTVEEAKAIASFRDADVLRGFFLTRWLVDFPPPVLQLLLSASAGAFGALLITLILLVYPKTDLNFSTSGGFWERIMLGGFIAVCVYIVVLGGTAVLGTASFDQGGANYMTFCAISVLAGMFSDRVAHWLSNRADLFFKDEGRADPPQEPREP